MKVIFYNNDLVKAVKVLKEFTPKKKNYRGILDTISITVNEDDKVLLKVTDGYIYACIEMKDAEVFNEGFKNEINLNAKQLYQLIESIDSEMILDDNKLIINEVSSYDIESMEVKDKFPVVTINEIHQANTSFVISPSIAARLFKALSKEFDNISIIKNSTYTLSFNGENNKFKIEGLISIMRKD